MEDKTLIQQVWLLIHFVPFIGPARYATEAILAYIEGNQERARDKGITSTINGLIDLAVLSVFLLSATHVSIECERSDILRAVKPVLTASVVLTVASILIGAKIIAEQIARAVVDKVLSMHTASASMVNTMHITATGIEAVVETINTATSHTTNTVKSGYNSAANTVKTVINTPKTTRNYCEKILRQILRHVKLTTDYVITKFVQILRETVKTMITLAIMLANITLNIIAKIINKILPGLSQNPTVINIQNMLYPFVCNVSAIVYTFRVKLKIV
ncbi:unnamed protein product [Oppiella nova]|uniref:Uncharacterized protein n=1 Tax=Oppiella nova TaxID=334625 RepID=A0A7R9M7A9_9ACAR|nr:unnamed protein product [Oppiella nova]CAG2172119.1 unnamed protein product [Oppiella nova]